MAFAAGVSGCDNIKMNINGSDFDGKPLAEIDLSGPAPTEVALMGPDIVTITEGSEFAITVSGTITSESLDDEAEINVLGSGRVDVAKVAASKLEINIAGSGSLKASGTADKLEMSIMGSGNSDLSGLKVGNAGVNVMGSGDAQFASDGKVDASIMGSATSLCAAAPRAKSARWVRVRCAARRVKAAAPPKPPLLQPNRRKQASRPTLPKARTLRKPPDA
ncbi:DUF2807 domain-containing protein [Alteriqipengyuania flavescens]|uniref:GIN domain-containing protein n=1 Tax=Alteriqipengyuania flavescens TaxID=3053610 RepID=UPI0025B53DDE|nr:DUF2807 domain-containing protein [Alteriqipengyuania flavescens]WJY19576.1 DUF2807 domain-containing protein [Alteriqipengyuania flavescens]WJY25516.1 DUF2807 domain-containing protein [Alteriqipengyuania flavescens]